MTAVPDRGTPPPPPMLVLAVFIALGLLPAREARAVPACTTAQVVSQDAGCPNSQAACNITRLFEVGTRLGAACAMLDFGTRAVTITSAGELDIGPGTVTLRAGSLTIAPGGRIDGLGVPPLGQGGMLTIRTTGAVDLQRSGLSRGTIDLSSDLRGGTLLIVAGGNVTLSGRLQLNALTGVGTGGSGTIRTDGNLVTTGGIVEATGRAQGGGGTYDFQAGGSATFGDMDISGGFIAGAMDVFARGEVVLNRLNAGATGDAGAGGCLGLTAGTQLRFLGPILASGSGSPTNSGGGCGGFIDAQAISGNLVVNNDLRVEGAAPDGAGGDIDLEARGSVTVATTAAVSARGNGEQGCGGELGIHADIDILVAGRLDITAAVANVLEITSRRDTVISGRIDANGRGPGSSGGSVTTAAGEAGNRGRIVLGNVLDVGGGSCSQLAGCGNAGAAELVGCDVTISSSGSILARAPTGGQTSITARESVSIQGPIDASATIPGGNVGSNAIIHRTGRTPTIAATITPTPAIATQPPCTAPNQPPACLIPCPICGNGVVEFPETCDTSGTPPQSCDGCSVLCRTENCNDPDPCTTDSCAPAIGCGNVRNPGCTATTTTTTRTTTTSTTRPPCRLDVDRNGVAETATDIVYIARHKLALVPVPPSFRVGHPEIPPDATLRTTIDALGTALDVDTNGVVETATDVVYIARHLLALAAPVPPSFRVGHPEIPSDATIRARVDALCLR